MPSRKSVNTGAKYQAYVAWVNMRQRCTNPKRKDWKNYGKRGLQYSKDWEKFEKFLADMGLPKKEETLDRKDNDGDYCKENCRWATRAVQNLNRRSCVLYELNGVSKTLAEWSRETGIGRVTMLKRIQAGIPVELALTTKGFLGYKRGLR